MKQEGWKLFIDFCHSTEDKQKLSELFDLLLTPQEKESISMRCLIIAELLQHKHSQREIAKNLNVSIAKITRGSNELKRLDDQFIQYLKKLIK